MCKDKVCGGSCISKLCSYDFVLLVLRVVLGIVFLAHGLQKIMNMEGTIAFFASFSIPAFFAYIVAWVEFLAGISLILGIFTCMAGTLIALIMVFAIILVKSKAGNFLAIELDMLAFASAIFISVAGPGRFSILKGKCCPMGKCSKEVCGSNDCTPSVSCKDKCCDKKDCNCGDCKDCTGCNKGKETSQDKCVHEDGCTCGDCDRCK